MNKNLVIDRSKCISCGLCVSDCISKSLQLNRDRIPEFAQDGENRCIECQHCFAICPTGALSILDRKVENSPQLPMPDSKAVLNTIRSRRSTRQFKDENISPETMKKLKNALNYVPTGCNDHRLIFTIIDNKEDMDIIRNYASKRLINILRFLPFIGTAQKFIHYKKMLMSGIDVIFRNAPHIIVASSPIDAPCKDIDPIIALSYFELYANSLGIGTCWCGFAQACFKICPQLIKSFKIPEDYKPVYVMLFGLPKIKYTRETIPEPYTFTTPDLSLLKK